MTNNPHLGTYLIATFAIAPRSSPEAGALVSKGDAPQYQVTCDQSINTALTRDAGQVNVEVMLRLVAPPNRCLLICVLAANV